MIKVFVILVPIVALCLLAVVRTVFVWSLPVGPQSVRRVTPFDRAGTVATVSGIGLVVSLLAIGLDLPDWVALTAFAVFLVAGVVQTVIARTDRLVFLQPPQLRWMNRNDVDFELPGGPDA